MNYKKEIIEMIEKITKTENISMLYGVVKTMVEYLRVAFSLLQ